MQSRVQAQGRAILNGFLRRAVRAAGIDELHAVVEDQHARRAGDHRVVTMHQQIRERFDHRIAQIIGAGAHRRGLVCWRDCLCRTRRARIPQINVTTDELRGAIK